MDSTHKNIKKRCCHGDNKPVRHRAKGIRSAAEVADMFGVSEWTILLWLDRFGTPHPRRNNRGILLFTPADIEKIEIIFRLSNEKGITVEKVREYLRG